MSFSDTSCCLLMQATLKTSVEKCCKSLQMKVYLLNRVENIVAKGEIANLSASEVPECGKGLKRIDAWKL